MGNLTIEMYHMIYQTGIILTIVFGLMSVTLFFAFRIRHTVSDMTGRTKVQERKKGNKERKKNKSITKNAPSEEATTLLSEHFAASSDNNATTVLPSQRPQQKEEYGETDMLKKLNVNTSNVYMEIINEITFIHASEIIMIE